MAYDQDAADWQREADELREDKLSLKAEVERLRELAYAPDGKECRSLLFEEAAKRLPLQEEINRLQTALERIALLDEADGHELTADHALQAVAIATSTLGKHPSEIFAARTA